jgi:hypothetical protein
MGLGPEKEFFWVFVICKIENLRCKAGLAKLDEIRKLNSTKLAILIVTNADHPIRPYFMNPNKLDEYAMRPRNPQPLFVRTVKYLDETQIDIRKILNVIKIRQTALATS